MAPEDKNRIQKIRGELENLRRLMPEKLQPSAALANRGKEKTLGSCGEVVGDFSVELQAKLSWGRSAATNTLEVQARPSAPAPHVHPDQAYRKDWRGNGLSNSQASQVRKTLEGQGIGGGGDPSKTSDRDRQRIRSLAKSGRLPSSYRNFR